LHLPRKARMRRKIAHGELVFGATKVEKRLTATTKKSKTLQPLPQNSNHKCAYMLRPSSAVNIMVKKRSSAARTRAVSGLGFRDRVVVLG